MERSACKAGSATGRYSPSICPLTWRTLSLKLTSNRPLRPEKVSIRDELNHAASHLLATHLRLRSYFDPVRWNIFVFHHPARAIKQHGARGFGHGQSHDRLSRKIDRYLSIRGPICGKIHHHSLRLASRAVSSVQDRLLALPGRKSIVSYSPRC